MPKPVQTVFPVRVEPTINLAKANQGSVELRAGDSLGCWIIRKQAVERDAQLDVDWVNLLLKIRLIYVG